MAKIITSVGKGAAVSGAEDDANLSALAGVNRSVTGTSDTITVADQNGTVQYLNASSIAVTLGSIASLSGSNIDTDDFEVTLKNLGVGVVTVTRGSTDTFDDTTTSKTLAQFEWITIQTDNGLTKWNIIGSSDASKVDGLDASQFIRSDANDTTTGNQTMSKSAPTYFFQDTGGAADRGVWGIAISTIAWKFNTNTDVFGAGATWGQIDRGSTTTVDKITWTATSIDLAGAIDLNGVTLTATAPELNRSDLTAATGTVTAEENLTTDSSKDIGTFNNVTSTTFTGALTGNVTGNADSADEADKLVDTNAVDALTVVTTASAANNVRVTNNTTGNAAKVDCSETNSDLDFPRNGTGEITVDSTPIYGLVLLDTPVILVTDATTTATSQTAVDITAQTTGVAVKAILNIKISSTVSAAGASEVLVGEGDETLATIVNTAVHVNTQVNNVTIHGATQMTVNLATGEIFDYAILQSGVAPTTRTVTIYLAGYYV